MERYLWKRFRFWFYRSALGYMFVVNNRSKEIHDLGKLNRTHRDVIIYSMVDYTFVRGWRGFVKYVKEGCNGCRFCLPAWDTDNKAVTEEVIRKKIRDIELYLT
jgi:hypothetical protein